MRYNNRILLDTSKKNEKRKALIICVAGNCSVHPQINVKFQKEKREVMSNNKP